MSGEFDEIGVGGGDVSEPVLDGSVTVKQLHAAYLCVAADTARQLKVQWQRTQLMYTVTSISIGTLCSDQLQQHIHRTGACSYQDQHQDSVLRSAATTDTQNWSMQLPASASGLCAAISCNNTYTELKHAVTSISNGTLCSDQLQQQMHRTGACSYQHQHQDSVLRSAATTDAQNWSTPD